MDVSDRADFLEDSDAALNERVRQRCENALRYFAQEIGVMSDENDSPVVREADSPSVQPAIGSTPVLRGRFRQARGRWYRSIYTQTPGSIEQILQGYMRDNIIEEGRSEYSPPVLVQKQDGTVRFKLESNDIETDHAEFDFAEFNGQQPRSPSPEPERNDRSNGSIHSPIPEEEEGEASESDVSEPESVIATPERIPRRQPSIEIEQIENDLLNGENPIPDYGRYRVENRLAQGMDERERIKNGYRYLTLGELRAKLASKGRRARRVCEHIHELEEAVLFLRASRQHLRKIETKESVLEELIVSHERMRRRQIGLSDYHLASSSGSLGPYTTGNNVYGA